MTDKPRYRLGAKGMALTRLQWWIYGVAMLAAAVSLVLWFAGKEPEGGGLVLSFAVLTASVTLVVARIRRPGG